MSEIASTRGHLVEYHTRPILEILLTQSGLSVVMFQNHNETYCYIRAPCRLFNRPIFDRVGLLARTLDQINSRVGGECANKLENSRPTILERVFF
jgi:hypothetical protein